MAEITKIIPCVEFAPAGDIAGIAAWALKTEDYGADGIMISFERDVKENPAEYFNAIRECARTVDIPIWVRASYFRLEDVKKLLYAGAERCVFFKSDEADMQMYSEAMLRFGADRCILLVGNEDEMPDDASASASQTFISASVHSDLPAILAEDTVDVLLLNTDGDDCDYFALKNALAESGIKVDRFESTMDPAGFKYDDKGLIPVVVQDARTDEVLMMAYMNEESFRITCATGRMTYFSRSRQSLWIKGETSGHYQYVKSLAIDCDQDTILAKVRQVGAACHTGNRTCFYRPLVTRGGDHPDPRKVLNEVYAVIKDRKDHPKEGSYTNYLFDKGVDKILKKLGEEATEIVIAAKNPESEEIIYETADFMYHLMVLMAEKGINWDDIMEELSKRESSK